MITLLMYSEDAIYTTRFALYVRTSRWRERIQFHTFTEWHSFQEAYSAPYSPRICMIDEACWNQAAELACQDERFLWIRLVHTQSADHGNHEDRTAIGKYQAASIILQQIMERYEAVHGIVGQEAGEMPMGMKENHSGAMKVLAVTSPFGGAGVSLISYHLARNLAIRQDKVLYFNLEIYPLLGTIQSTNSDYDFSRMLYQLMSNQESLYEKWPLYCEQHEATGLYSFRTPLARRDLRELRVEHIQAIIDIGRRAGFSYIVLDADAYWLDDLLDRRIAYDECYLVCPERDLPTYKGAMIRDFADKLQARLIVNQLNPDASDGRHLDSHDYCRIPYISGLELVATATHEHLDASIGAMIHEYIAIEEGGSHD